MEYNSNSPPSTMMGLRVARSLGARNVLLKSDLKLVIGKINGEYEAKESKM